MRRFQPLKAAVQTDLRPIHAIWNRVARPVMNWTWLVCALLAVGLVGGCGDRPEGGMTRLSPRGIPFFEGIPVPSGFTLVDKMSEDYESGGVRFARHEYAGKADPHAVRSFYREQMPLMGWNRVSDQNVKGRITIRFEKQDEECTVEIESAGTFNQATVQVIVKPFTRTPSEPPPRRPVP